MAFHGPVVLVDVPIDCAGASLDHVGDLLHAVTLVVEGYDLEVLLITHLLKCTILQPFALGDLYAQLFDEVHSLFLMELGEFGHAKAYACLLRQDEEVFGGQPRQAHGMNPL